MRPFFSVVVVLWCSLLSDAPNSAEIYPSVGVAKAQVAPESSTVALDEAIAKLASERCLSIGFTAGTPEHKNCAVGQEKLLRATPERDPISPLPRADVGPPKAGDTQPSMGRVGRIENLKPGNGLVFGRMVSRMNGQIIKPNLVASPNATIRTSIEMFEGDSKLKSNPNFVIASGSQNRISARSADDGWFYSELPAGRYYVLNFFLVDNAPTDSVFIHPYKEPGVRPTVYTFHVLPGKANYIGHFYHDWRIDTDLSRKWRLDFQYETLAADEWAKLKLEGIYAGVASARENRGAAWHIANPFPDKSYVGPRVKGKGEGQGVSGPTNGMTYKGAFRDGVPDGYGVASFDGEGTYSGEWRFGEMSGQGTFVYDNGNKYVGAFSEGSRNGTGEFSRVSGAGYVGNFVDGFADGIGSEILPDGSKLTGKFVRDKKEGKFTHVTKAGDRTTLIYSKGERNGPWETTYANGERAVGNSVNGKWEGVVTTYRADGTAKGTFTYKAGVLQK